MLVELTEWEDKEKVEALLETIGDKKIETSIPFIKNWTEKYFQDMLKPRVSDYVLEDIFVKRFITKEDVYELISCINCTESNYSMENKDRENLFKLREKLIKLYPEKE